MELACFKHPPTTYALIIHCRQRKEKAGPLLISSSARDPTLFVVELNAVSMQVFCYLLCIPPLI